MLGGEEVHFGVHLDGVRLVVRDPSGRLVTSVLQTLLEARELDGELHEAMDRAERFEDERRTA